MITINNINQEASNDENDTALYTGILILGLLIGLMIGVIVNEAMS